MKIKKILKKFSFFIFVLSFILFCKVDAYYYTYDYTVPVGFQVSCPQNTDLVNGGKIIFDLGTNGFDGTPICGTTIVAGKYSCSGFADVNNDGVINGLDFTSTPSSQIVSSLLPGSIMKCAVIDPVNPTGTISYPSGNFNTAQNVNISVSDIGGSKLMKVELYEDKNETGYVKVNEWDLSGLDNSSLTWTRSVTFDGDYFSYKFKVYDRSWNVVEVAGTNVFYFDLTPTSTQGWYNFHSRDISLGCDEDGDTTGGEFLFDMGTNIVDGSNVCGKVVSGGKYACDYGTDINSDYAMNATDYTSSPFLQKVGGVIAPNNMICAMYDIQVPENLSLVYPTMLTSPTLTINLGAKDRGGSTLDRMILYRKKGTDPWVTLKTWANIADSTNTYIPKTYNDTLPVTTSTYKYFLRVYDVAGNRSDLAGPNVSVDTTPPTAADLSDTFPPDGTNMLATSLKNFSFNVSDGGGTPINYVSAYFEDYSTANSFGSIQTSNSGNWSYNENIQNVDLSRGANGARVYSLRVAKLCDSAGNCTGSDSPTSNIKTYNFYVYSNSLLMGINSVTNNELDDSSTADGVQKNLTITLKDIYGNAIIPASGIGRQIEHVFSANNTLNLNQYLKTGNGVFLNTPSDTSNYLNRIPLGVSSTSFTNQNSSNGNYDYGFKFYTPTQNTYSKAYGDFAFSNIITNISDSFGLGNNAGILISSSNFSARFNPLYDVTISGDIINDGFIEGGTQYNKYFISKNFSSTSPAYNLCMEFGSGDTNNINPNLNLKYSKVLPTTTSVGEGNGSCNMFSSPSLGDNYFYTRLLLQNGAKLSDIQNSYFSSHISYTLDGKNVFYNTDVYGKANYWGPVTGLNSYESALKVIGLTYTQKYNEIINGQKGNEIKIMDGTITKASLKEEIRKNAYYLIKALTPSNGLRKIDTLDFVSNSDGVKIKGNNVIYFGGLNGSNVDVNSGVYTGKRTIIIEGGNLYIKGNINAQTESSDILGIIVLKDENGNGGNVYIDPLVTRLESVIYADKAVISYNGSELGGNTSADTLKNQLYILGSVFSENTIGGSRNATPLCPYYVTSACTLEEAQKYDFNYLRRYYLKDTNSDGIGDTPAYGGTSYYGSSSPNYKYPLIIRYNSLIKTSPPPLFSN